MKKMELMDVDQSVFYEELASGLKVFVLPYPTKKNYYCVYSTKYGSINLEFKDNETNKMIKTNSGIAHFLEHKMFEMEDGIDPFQYFAKTGTGCNASTSYKKTMYYIYGINALEDNLNYLINCVNNPYFTDENVEKEKGIIIEEIKMYDDNPDWILMEEMFKATFKNHPIRLDIAGYVDSVSKITKEELYSCYNTFYQPSNMYLLIAGNVEPNKILDLIKNNESINKRITNNKITKKIIDEPLNVNEKIKTIECPSVTIPKLGFTIKLSLKDIKEKYLYYVYINIILDILFGNSSSFKETIYKEKCATSLFNEVMIVDDFLIIQFFSESQKPEELVDRILKQFKQKIDEEELKRHVKVQIATQVMLTDNIEATVDTIFSDLINWGELIDNKVAVLRKLNIKELNDIQKNINLKNNTTIILKGK